MTSRHSKFHSYPRPPTKRWRPIRLANASACLRTLLSGIATGALLVFSPPAWSQLKQINDPGITTTFARDNLKRLTAKTQNLTDAPASTRNVGYQWVPAGTGGGGELGGITYPSGKLLTYQYDSTGLITGVLWDGQPLISNLKWNPLGQPTSWSWPFTAGQGGTGLTAQRSYNTAGQLVSSETATYTWDAAGRVTQIGQQLFRPQAASNPNSDPTTAPLGVTSTFGYDAAGRLISVAHTPDTTSMPSPWVIQDIIGPLNTTYSWDANSNRTQASYTNYGGSGLTNSLTRTFTLEAGKNRIASVQDNRQISPTGTDTQTHSFDWDASGKLMRYHGGSLVFERDPAGRISAAQAGGSGRTTYQTNALAQRVRKQSNIETTHTVYGDDEAFPGTSSYPLGSYRVATQNGQSLQNTEYLYLPTAAGPMPIAMQIGNELLAVHTDHLNTPRRLTDSNGQPAWQWPTSGFGEVEPSTPATGWIRPRLGDAGEIPNTTQISFDLRYPGQQYDKETGLYYNHHRTYDPFLTVGYTEADPLGLNAGWNRFGYVGGNAVGAVDPAGKVAVLPVIIWGAPIIGASTWAALNPDAREALGRSWDSLVAWIKPPDNAYDPNGPKAPGAPGEAEGFSHPAGGPNWVPNPNPGRGGSSHGWEDDRGRVWCPTGWGNNAHGGPHWDVQLPGRRPRYVNVRPGQNINDLLN